MAWLVTMGMGLVEVEVVSFVSDFRNESMASSLRSSHLLDISNDSAFRKWEFTCILTDFRLIYQHLRPEVWMKMECCKQKIIPFFDPLSRVGNLCFCSSGLD